MKLLQRRQHRSQVGSLFGRLFPSGSGPQVIHRSRQGIGLRLAGLGLPVRRIRAPTANPRSNGKKHSQPTHSHSRALQRDRSKKSREGSVPNGPTHLQCPPNRSQKPTLHSDLRDLLPTIAETTIPPTRTVASRARRVQPFDSGPCGSSHWCAKRSSSIRAGSHPVLRGMEKRMNCLRAPT